MKLPLFIGKSVYILTKPGIYRMLKGSVRVYVVIRAGNDILVTKNWLGLHKVWRLPGGGIQKGETITDALQREVREELGLKIDTNNLKQLQKNAYYEPTKKFKYYLFLLDSAEKPNLQVNQKEIVASEWIPTNELHKLPISEELKIALTTVK